MLAEWTGLEPATPGVTGRGSREDPCGFPAESYSKRPQKPADFTGDRQVVFQTTAPYLAGFLRMSTDVEQSPKLDPLPAQRQCSGAMKVSPRITTTAVHVTRQPGVPPGFSRFIGRVAMTSFAERLGGAAHGPSPNNRCQDGVVL